MSKIPWTIEIYGLGFRETSRGKWDISLGIDFRPKSIYGGWKLGIGIIFWMLIFRGKF